jgi:multidrug resistance efflux pump
MGQWLRKPVVIIIIVVVVALAGFLVSRAGSTESASTKSNITTVTRGDLTTLVSGSSNIVAEQTVSLAFQSNGIVNTIAIKEGDTVNKGQVLATIDARDLEYQLASAKASYDSAKAKLDQLTSGAGRSSELASAQAAVTSAQAQLASAQDKLASLKNPTRDKISAAQLKVQQAETSLQTTRDSNSANKTKAELDLAKASESLIQAQSKYGVAKYNWDWVERNNTDPSTGRGPISDASKNSYRDSLVQSESALRTAEQSVQAAQVTFDNTKAAEIANVAQAEASLTDAKLQLATLLKPTAADISAAEASVRQSEASLESAKASLDKIVTPGTQTDIAMQNQATTKPNSGWRMPP